MKLLIVIILNLSILAMANAQTTYIVASGCGSCNYDNSSTWVGGIVPSGGVPAAGSTIRIPAGETLTLTGPTNIDNQVTIEIFGIMDLSSNGAKINLSDAGSVIQIASSGDIITNNSNSNQLRIGSGFIKGSTIDDLASPNQVTQETLNSNDGGCAESGTCEVDPLPVELIFFEGRFDAKSKNVMLNWATLTEENFDYFEISRSSDGHQFTLIDTVRGAGTTTVRQNYQFIDNNPYPGINYYRLRSVDFDGYTETFDLVAVHTDFGFNPVIFPNPAVHGDITVRGMETNNPITLRLYDLNGKMEMIFEVLNEQKIRLPETLQAGIYLIELSSGNYHHKSRILIQ